MVMMFSLKPSVASDTGSAHKLFNAARLKLTAVSVLVVALIVLAFSYYIYQNIISDIADIGSRTTAVEGDTVQKQFVHQTTTSVANSLLYADIGILILAAGLSFYFAGRTLRPIQKANAAQRAFATHASHELRTPLAILKSDTEMLSRASSPSSELVHDIVASNLEEIERMERIVEDLLALARSERKQSKEVIDLAILAKKSTEKFQKLAYDRGVNLVCTGVVAAPLCATRDFDRALTNLIQNALDHTPKGGRVEVAVYTTLAHVHLVVTDTGSGITHEDLPHVFERFYKGAHGRGSGLGLSLVKEIIERHGGTVSLVSEAGKGTIVTVRLPMKS